MTKNILALGLLAFSLFSCGDASGGNKNILPKDPEAVVETPHDSVHAQVTDTIKKQDQSHTAEKATQVKADSIKVNSEAK